MASGTGGAQPDVEMQPARDFDEDSPREVKKKSKEAREAKDEAERRASSVERQIPVEDARACGERNAKRLMADASFALNYNPGTERPATIWRLQHFRESNQGNPASSTCSPYHLRRQEQQSNSSM